MNRETNNRFLRDRLIPGWIPAVLFCCFLSTSFLSLSAFAQITTQENDEREPESISDVLRSPWDANLFNAIAKERDRLKLKEKELQEKEQRLDQLKQEIEVQVAQLEKYRKMIEDERKEIVKLYKDQEPKRQKKIKILVKMYQNMKAEEAAKVLPSMDVELVVDILSRLKAKNSGKIMEKLEAKLAASLSEKIAKVKEIKKIKQKSPY